MSEIAIIGTGPAALMAAHVLTRAKKRVILFEKRKSAGRKLLVAGSSGLNISNSLPLDEFISHYRGASPEFWNQVIRGFPPQSWLSFIHEMGVGTFEGTSGRYFIEEMKAAAFLKTWLARLQSQGARFEYDRECVGFEPCASGIEIKFQNSESAVFQAVLFALGGGSWEPNEVPLRWPKIFKRNGIGFDEFTPSNVGYQVRWSEGFLKEAEGLPLKKIVMSSARATREGDAMITSYGIEGTPVYFAGTPGRVTVDLRPDLSQKQILAKLQSVKENLSPIRRVKKTLQLCPASLALVFHHTPEGLLKDSSKLAELAALINAFPLDLGEPQPLSEAISSAGGVRMDELNSDLMLKKIPGAFAAGEMLSWDVPTGGFLLQACVAQGHLAAHGILKFLSQA